MPEAKKVKKLFKAAAFRYNLTNTIMTFGLDALWRDALAKKVIKTKAKKIADLACGPGVLSFAIGKQYEKEKEFCQIIGYDFCEEFLEMARHDVEKFNFKYSKLNFVYADALKLPLEDNSLNAVTIGFGLRNFESREKAYKEIIRVLKPDGALFILETSQPVGIMKPLYYLYAPFIPLLARILGTNPESYKHLVDTQRAFPSAETIAKELETFGFKEVNFKRLFGGVVAIHEGKK